MRFCELLDRGRRQLRAPDLVDPLHLAAGMSNFVTRHRRSLRGPAPHLPQRDLRCQAVTATKAAPGGPHLWLARLAGPLAFRPGKRALRLGGGGDRGGSSWLCYRFWRAAWAGLTGRDTP